MISSFLFYSMILNISLNFQLQSIILSSLVINIPSLLYLRIRLKMPTMNLYQCVLTKIALVFLLYTRKNIKIKTKDIRKKMTKREYRNLSLNSKQLRVNIQMLQIIMVHSKCKQLQLSKARLAMIMTIIQAKSTRSPQGSVMNDISKKVIVKIIIWIEEQQQSNL